MQRYTFDKIDVTSFKHVTTMSFHNLELLALKARFTAELLNFIRHIPNLKTLILQSSLQAAPTQVCFQSSTLQRMEVSCQRISTLQFDCPALESLTIKQAVISKLLPSVVPRVEYLHLESVGKGNQL